MNKLADQYNNTYHHSINIKLSNDDYSVLAKLIETNPKAPNFKVNVRVRITKYKNAFSKGYNENWSKELFIIDSVLQTNLWAYEVKGLSGWKMMESFYEKELLRSKI